MAMPLPEVGEIDDGADARQHLLGWSKQPHGDPLVIGALPAILQLALDSLRSQRNELIEVIAFRTLRGSEEISRQGTAAALGTLTGLTAISVTVTTLDGEALHVDTYQLALRLRHNVPVGTTGAVRP